MCEDAPCCGCCGSDFDSGEPTGREREEYSPSEISELEMDEAKGWPGDGSGEDDLADYNQNEADDYSGED